MSVSVSCHFKEIHANCIRTMHMYWRKQSINKKTSSAVPTYVQTTAWMRVYLLGEILLQHCTSFARTSIMIIGLLALNGMLHQYVTDFQLRYKYEVYGKYVDLIQTKLLIKRHVHRCTDFRYCTRYTYRNTLLMRSINKRPPNSFQQLHDH